MFTGIIEAIGNITSVRSVRFSIDAPAELARYIAAKGSITVDGVSLTTNAITATGFELNIVPHTAEQTTLAQIQAGDRVHLEVDIIARYLEQLLGTKQNDNQSQITPDFLSENGFWK